MNARIQSALFGVKSMHRNTLAIGCESPLARGRSRNTARNAAFSIPTPSFGGSDGMAQAMPATPRVPRSLTPIRAAAPCESGTAVVYQAQLAGGLLTAKTLKSCTKCGIEKPFSNFYKQSDKKDGHQSSCKACSAADRGSYYVSKQDKRRAASLAWRAANLERSTATTAAWREANRERNEATKAAYVAANPELARIYKHNRRAKIIAVGGKLSSGLSEKLFHLQKGKCPCCGEPLGNDYHLDHKMPLALGGANIDDNMQLLRAACNLQKHAKHPVDFMLSRGFLL